ncbi:MAG TPA: protein-glutamate O-methyltransferase CheR [Gemmatimonadales bacterium]|nr:protein-glutamate O-methyltransferase CheR [Gemmatimonadales bacterium]
MTLHEDPGFDALALRIAGQAGLDVSAYKDRCLRRRLAVRMRACGVHTYTDYLAVLDRSPEEFERLLDALTINVTKFFRNRETWDTLAAGPLPKLLKAREGRLRVWSAGCSSGEEPYTITMLMVLVLEQMGRAGWLDRIRVDATDFDKASLDTARAARYPLKAFSEAAEEIPRRFCRPVDADTVEVLPELRAMVHFLRSDLLREPPPSPPYDLIFCRNVVIYFDRGTQEQLMLRFTEALAPGGILVLGKVETIFGPARERLELVDPRERIYRRAA